MHVVEYLLGCTFNYNTLSSVVVCPDGGRAHKRSKKRSHGDRVSFQEFSELREKVTDMRKEFGKITKLFTAFPKDSDPQTQGLDPQTQGLDPHTQGSVPSTPCLDHENVPGLDTGEAGASHAIPFYEEINLGLDLNSDDSHLRDNVAEEKVEESFELTLEGDETLGPAIRDPLATYATTCVTKRIERDHLKALKQKAKRPANCPNVVVPQVNPAIWRELDRFSKVRDVHMQSTQELSVQSLQLALAMKERLSSSEESKVEDVGSMCARLITYLGNASLEMSFRRRELLKPSINRRYHSLCGPSTKVGVYLFGDRMEEDMREIAEAAKVSRGIVAANHGKGGANNASSRHYSGSAGRSQAHGPHAQRYAARPLNWGGRHGPYHQDTRTRSPYNQHTRTRSPYHQHTRTRSHTGRTIGPTRASRCHTRWPQPRGRSA